MGGLLPYISAPLPPARPPQYLHTSIPSPTPSYLYLFMARRRMYLVYRPRGLLNTSIPPYHPPHHPTSTFSWRGGGCTSCTARAASSIPPYLHTIPHTILPLPFHGEAADVPRVPPARPPQYLHTSIPSPTPSYLYLFMAR